MKHKKNLRKKCDENTGGNTNEDEEDDSGDNDDGGGDTVGLRAGWVTWVVVGLNEAQEVFH